MIEQYTGRTISCACGRQHRSKVERVVIEKGVISNGLVDFLKEND